METISEGICSLEARVGPASTWFDLRALSCPFLPRSRSLSFLSPQSCRNPWEYFVLTGKVLEEKNDDCKEQLENPHS